MPMPEPSPIVVVPGDDPIQIADSPQLDRLRERAEVRVYRDRPADAGEQIARTRDADIVLNSRGQVAWSGQLFGQLPRLKMLTTCSIGVDSIDIAGARQHDVVVSNVPGLTAPVVAEHTLALMLAAAKRLSYQTSELKSGRWTKRTNLMLAGGVLGVIGLGAIGSSVARLAQAIGMKVIAWSYHPSPERAAALGVEFVEFDDLLAAADVVSVHVKLTDDSRGMLGARELALMKPSALLVNTARGQVVDTNALIQALDSGNLAGAALDVFDEEPLPPDSPILNCEQVVLTPHAADQTPAGIELLNTGAVDNILAFLEGAPRNQVT
ncbi:MAG: NAD(P)-dependent oxidoreductase [Pirellulaceae bacterium]|nr:NAD(P)-dependent oxidoreductase [Pirellulaceae bacterium]